MLIEHYRAEYERHGYGPRHAYVGAGSGFLYLADTTQQAKQYYGPVYERMVAFFNRPGNHTPGNEMTFRDIDHAIAEGPALVGSPQQIIDKIGYFHEGFGHDLQAFSLPTVLPHEQQLEMLERFATEVVPVIRKQAPTTLWTDTTPTAAALPSPGDAPRTCCRCVRQGPDRTARSSGDQRRPRCGTRFRQAFFEDPYRPIPEPFLETPIRRCGTSCKGHP